MIFSEQDRKTLEKIWQHLSIPPPTPPVAKPPAPDLLPLLNELGQAVGRVEQAQKNSYDRLQDEFIQRSAAFEAKLASMSDERVRDAFEAGYDEGVDSKVCSKCVKKSRPAKKHHKGKKAA